MCRLTYAPPMLILPSQSRVMAKKRSPFSALPAFAKLQLGCAKEAKVPGKGGEMCKSTCGRKKAESVVGLLSEDFLLDSRLIKTLG